MRENQAIGPFSKGDTTVHCCCHFDVARKKANVPHPHPHPFPPNLHIFKTRDGLHCAMAAQMKRESKYFEQLIGRGGRCSKVLAHLLDGLEDPEEVEARQLLQLVHRPVARVEECDKELRVAGHVGEADGNPVIKIF